MHPVIAVLTVFGLAVLGLTACQRDLDRNMGEVQVRQAPRQDITAASPMDMPDWYRTLLEAELARQQAEGADNGQTAVRGYW